MVRYGLPPNFDSSDDGSENSSPRTDEEHIVPSFRLAVREARKEKSDNAKICKRSDLYLDFMADYSSEIPENQAYGATRDKKLPVTRISQLPSLDLDDTDEWLKRQQDIQDRWKQEDDAAVKVLEDLASTVQKRITQRLNRFKLAAAQQLKAEEAAAKQRAAIEAAAKKKEAEEAAQKQREAREAADKQNENSGTTPLEEKSGGAVATQASGHKTTAFAADIVEGKDGVSVSPSNPISKPLRPLNVSTGKTVSASTSGAVPDFLGKLDTQEGKDSTQAVKDANATGLKSPTDPGSHISVSSTSWEQYERHKQCLLNLTTSNAGFTKWMAEQREKRPSERATRAISRSLNSMINGLAGTLSDVADKSDRVEQLLRDWVGPANSEVLVQLSRKIVKQCGEMVSKSPQYAWPLAMLVCEVSKVAPEFPDVFLATIQSFDTGCPLCVPMYTTYKVAGRQLSTEEWKQRNGFRFLRMF